MQSLQLFNPIELNTRTQLLGASLCSAGIGTVINLQLPGEHAKCGPGLESSGFTYQPEELMRHGGEGEGREEEREREGSEGEGRGEREGKR